MSDEYNRIIDATVLGVSPVWKIKKESQMKKYRKGPWEVSNFGDGPAIYDKESNPVALAIGYKKLQLPNARLIAAAPDLLEACKAMLATEITGEGQPEAMDAIQRAIAKAEKGESK